MPQPPSDPATISRVTIRPAEGPATALLCIYPGQRQPQPCYIALDTRDGRLWAAYDAEIGTAVPADVWHGLVRRYAIPVLQPATANALMEELRPLAERVVAGTEIRWDGSNHVARLDEDAQLAEAQIAAAPYQYGPGDVLTGRLYELDSDVFWADADDWLAPERNAIVRQLRSGEATAGALAALYQGDGSSAEEPYIWDLDDELDLLARFAQDEEE